MKPKAGLRILVVEDDFLVSELIQNLLQGMGLDCIGSVMDGNRAVETARISKPDVILMDIAMPGLDGLEATRRIQEICPTPVVVLTAYESPDLVQRAHAAGVGAYLVKPPTAPELERAIHIAVTRFRDTLELRRLHSDLEEERQKLKAALAEIDAIKKQPPGTSG